MVKWSEMLDEERDRLVAKKVFHWIAKPCKGEIGEKSISADGWFCQECGYSGYWGDDFEHYPLPERYSSSVCSAWKIVELSLWDNVEIRLSHIRVQDKLAVMPGIMALSQMYTCVIWKGHSVSRAPGKSVTEAICKAALLAVGEDIDD